MVTAEEKKLLDELKLGKECGARRLYWWFEKTFGSLIGFKAESWADAAELKQDTFLHLLDALPLFGYRSTLKTFTYRLVQHELSDYWRKKYAKKLIRTVPLVGQWVDKIYKSEETAKKFESALKQAYSKMKPIYVTVLRLKYEEERTTEEMATELAMTPKAVEGLLYRARREFKEKWIDFVES